MLHLLTTRDFPYISAIIVQNFFSIVTHSSFSPLAGALPYYFLPSSKLYFFQDGNTKGWNNQTCTFWNSCPFWRTPLSQSPFGMMTRHKLSATWCVVLQRNCEIVVFSLWEDLGTAVSPNRHKHKRKDQVMNLNVLLDMSCFYINVWCWLIEKIVNCHIGPL